MIWVSIHQFDCAYIMSERTRARLTEGVLSHTLPVLMTKVDIYFPDWIAAIIIQVTNIKTIIIIIFNANSPLCDICINSAHATNYKPSATFISAASKRFCKELHISIRMDNFPPRQSFSYRSIVYWIHFIQMETRATCNKIHLTHQNGNFDLHSFNNNW